jgi:hypothetical protein
MKGCSSLGLRYAVLLGVTHGKREHDEYCLIDIKEAAAAAAPVPRMLRSQKIMPSGWWRAPSTYRRRWASACSPQSCSGAPW